MKENNPQNENSSKISNDQINNLISIFLINKNDNINNFFEDHN